MGILVLSVGGMSGLRCAGTIGGTDIAMGRGVSMELWNLDLIDPVSIIDKNSSEIEHYGSQRGFPGTKMFSDTGLLSWLCGIH